jgi:drug/metabolite transporter (DMT)-like permease
VIAVLGGLGAAVSFAISTLAYSRATRMLTPFVVLGWVMLVGLVLIVPAVLLFGLPVSFTADSVFWLALVGIGNVGGLLMEFLALRSGKVGIVATIASTEGAIAAVLAVIAGEPLSVAVALALVVVVVGVLLTTLVPGEVHELEGSSGRRAAVLAGGAALLFGLGLFATGRVEDTIPVVWILVPARVIGVLGIALPLAAVRRLPTPGVATPFVIVAGIAEVTGFASFAIGAREAVAVSAVLVSQFATIALVLAYLLFGERITRLQLAGIALVVTGVAGVTVLRAA